MMNKYEAFTPIDIYKVTNNSEPGQIIRKATLLIRIHGRELDELQLERIKKLNHEIRKTIQGLDNMLRQSIDKEYPNGYYPTVFLKDDDIYVFILDGEDVRKVSIDNQYNHFIIVDEVSNNEVLCRNWGDVI